MSADKSREIVEVYSALGHPLRKKIVEIIGEKGSAGFKELKDMLNVSVGTLYYHLDVLEDFVTQNKQRKYVLTDRGKLSLRLVGSSEEQLKVAKIALKAKKPSVLSSFAREIIFARRLFITISSNPLRYVPEALIAVGFGGWIFAQAGIEPIMMFYDNLPAWSSPTIIMAEFFAGWLAVFGLCEVFSMVFFRRFAGNLNLLISSAFSLMPLLILPVALYIGQILAPGLQVNWTLIQILLLVFQAWVLSLLTAALGFSKGVKLEKAALVSLSVMYCNIAIFILAVLHL